MSFERWGYQFDGLYNFPSTLDAKDGVYVVWCQEGDNKKILDVGESENVKDRLSNHDRADCWKRNCSGDIKYSATYISNKDERIRLEQKIRQAEKVLCGEK